MFEARYLETILKYSNHRYCSKPKRNDGEGPPRRTIHFWSTRRSHSSCTRTNDSTRASKPLLFLEVAQNSLPPGSARMAVVRRSNLSSLKQMKKLAPKFSQLGAVVSNYLCGSRIGSFLDRQHCKSPHQRARREVISGCKSKLSLKGVT